MSESGYLAELTMDGLTLLLAQEEIRLLESVEHLRGNPEGFLLESSLGEIPVFSLDRRLQPLATIPQERRLCVLLRHPQGLFALAVSGFRLIPREDCRLMGLPPTLRMADSPITALAVMDERIVPVSDVHHLASRLPSVASCP